MAGTDSFDSFAARNAFFQTIIFVPRSFSFMCTLTVVGIILGSSSPLPLEVLGVHGSLLGVDEAGSLLDVDAPLADDPFFLEVIIPQLSYNSSTRNVAARSYSSGQPT